MSKILGAARLPGLRSGPVEVSQVWIADEDHRLHPGAGGDHSYLAAPQEAIFHFLQAAFAAAYICYSIVKLNFSGEDKRTFMCSLKTLKSASLF